MDQLIPLSSNHLHLLIHPNPGASHLLLDLAASLCQHGALTVLDGGNCFNIYTLAQALRRRGANVRLSLGRIQVARAFTCYQMAALICQASAEATDKASAKSPTPADIPEMINPLMVLDFLNTFQDENVSLEERRRLLQSCLPALRRRCQVAPILVSIRKEVPEFMEILAESADDIWRAEALPQPPLQMTLGIEL